MKMSRTFKNELVKLGIFALCLFVVFNFIVKLNVVPTGSMMPTINVGDITVSNALAYIKENPERGDIVIFKSESGKLLVKRIVGMPNDVISFVDGYVVINGMVAEEEYIDSEIETNCENTFVVPEGHYFMLGDNRENSLDSRFFNEPYIKKSDIVAELLFVIPLSELKDLGNK